MSKLKSILLMGLSMVLVAALSIGGTLAYLQDDDSAVNVMTLGNVSIRQNEEQRVDPSKSGTLTESDIEPFVQGNQLVPYVDNNLNKAMRDDYETLIGPDGNTYSRIFIGDNAVDKFVSVTNTGKTDAYVRTIIALERPTDKIDLAFGSEYWAQDLTASSYSITVGEQSYDLFVIYYKEVLKPGETTPWGFQQFLIDWTATNEDLAAYGDTYDVLALSQAVQAAGFADAKTALNAGFGEVNAQNAAEWFGGVIAEHSVDEWDGTVDTSWYNETDTEFTLTSAEQFAGFATLVSEDADNFAGKTINLGTSVDLNGKSFAPIGTTGERDSRNRLIVEPFKGTFDGNGNTIANISQSGWDFGYEWGQYGSLGLFSELENATVKNVVLEGFDCAVEGGDISFIAGSATGNCSFEDIEIKSGSIGTYNNGIGGIIGWSGAGTYNFKNITIGEDVVIGGLWGSFDSSVGGIVGQAEPGATYNFENVTVACQLDVFNDCTASYDYYNYRMCGMLIGRLEETTTIDGVNYPDTSKYNITCTNVTVTYGEWANYHYCDPTPGYNNGRGMRVESSANYSGLPADYDHSQCTTHHNELIPFDQIFGGDQLGVKGLKTYDGVTVVYNNK